ncbi:MAG: hypothetical protein ABDH21_02465 [bacterium]
MSIFISVCDYSSEFYASKLIEYIAKDVGSKIFVIGGDLLRNLSKKYSNVVFLIESVRYSSVGFFENLSMVPFILWDYLKLKRMLWSIKPTLSILFDSPAINVRLIRFLKDIGSKIIYIIPPRSWSLQRTKTHELVENNCEYVIVPFKFNLKVYQGKNILFFGHPMVEIIDKSLISTQEKCSLGIFPGSRTFEIKFVSRPVFDIIHILNQKFEKIIISATNHTLKYLNHLSDDFEICSNYEQIVNRIGIALSTSGTVVLKNVLYAIPTICFYRVYKISEWIFNNFVKMKVTKIALPNILAEYEFPDSLKDKYFKADIVPELLQDHCNSNSILSTLQKVIDNYDKYKQVVKEFRSIFFEFYPPQPIKDISEFVLDYYRKIT